MPLSQKFWEEHGIDPKDYLSKQCAGAMMCALMEANGYRKSGMRKKVPHPAYTIAEVYVPAWIVSTPHIMEAERTTFFANDSRPSSGNLYYVRLTTPLGLFYKLGFTTLGSVLERLAYQGNGHEEHIHHIFCFANFDDALTVEKVLHAHFRHRAAFPIPEQEMPFFGNGQSELYIENVLKMDDDYTEAQYAETALNIKRARMKRAGKTKDEINEHITGQEDVEELITLIRGPMLCLMRAYEKVLLFLNGSRAEKVKRARIQNLIKRVQDAKYEGF